MSIGLAEMASAALTRAMPDTEQSHSLQQAWLTADPSLHDAALSDRRRFINAERLSQRTVLDLLQDLPAAVDHSLTADLSIEPAARLNWSFAKEKVVGDLYGLALSPLELWRAEFRDRLFREKSTLLVKGRYVPNITHTNGRADARGQIQTDEGSINARGVAAEFAAAVIWAIGEASLEVNRQTSESKYWLNAILVRIDSAPLPLPRWSGHTRAACFARSLCMHALIADLDDASLSLSSQWQPQALRVALRAIHCPQSQREVATPEVRDAVRGVLRDMDTSVFDKTRLEQDSMLKSVPTRPVADWRDAELYAEEILRHLGFTDARHTPGGNDGGKDVIGRHMVCQVKFDAREAGRPDVQQLTGIAYVEDACAVFFSRGPFTSGAVEWAERVGIACIQFSEDDGSLTAITQVAHELLTSGQPPPRLQPRTHPAPATGYTEPMKRSSVELAGNT